jgi:hypothetical protein
MEAIRGLNTKELLMSNPTPVEPGHDALVEKDAVESVVHLMPIVLPLVGAVLMLLLASIAIYMA